MAQCTVEYFVSLLGSKILALVQSNGKMLFGMPIYGQQLLSAISLTITVIAVIFVKKVIEKQEVMIQ